jgi:hypothetical protein
MIATGTGWFTLGSILPGNLVQVWEVASEKERRRFIGHLDVVKAVAFTPDSRAVVSGSLDNTLLVWSVAEQQGPPRKLSGKELEKLWGDLASEDAAAAFQAVTALAGNPQGVPQFLKGKLPRDGPTSLKQAQRLRQLQQGDVRLLRDPKVRTACAQWLRELRLVEVLERAGTAEAKALLQALARGSLALVLTGEARAAVARLPAAGRKLP